MQWAEEEDDDGIAVACLTVFFNLMTSIHKQSSSHTVATMFILNTGVESMSTRAISQSALPE